MKVIVFCGGQKVNMSDKSDIRMEQIDSKSENIGMEEDCASNKVQGTMSYKEYLD